MTREQFLIRVQLLGLKWNPRAVEGTHAIRDKYRNILMWDVDDGWRIAHALGIPYPDSHVSNERALQLLANYVQRNPQE